MLPNLRHPAHLVMPGSKLGWTREPVRDGPGAASILPALAEGKRWLEEKCGFQLGQRRSGTASASLATWVLARCILTIHQKVRVCCQGQALIYPSGGRGDPVHPLLGVARLGGSPFHHHHWAFVPEPPALPVGLLSFASPRRVFSQQVFFLMSPAQCTSEASLPTSLNCMHPHGCWFAKLVAKMPGPAVQAVGQRFRKASENPNKRLRTQETGS